MPTVLAGQSFDLQESPENITLYCIRDRWKLVQDGVIPAKSDIIFSLFGWSGRKSYQVGIEPSSAPRVRELNIGSQQWTQYNDPIYVHVWIVKNRDEVPPQMHHITQRIEQIVRENVTNVGYGITSVRITTPFSAVETVTQFLNQIEVSLWHSRAIVELMYYRVTYNTLSGVRTSKTHKYNVVIT